MKVLSSRVTFSLDNNLSATVYEERDIVSSATFPLGIVCHIEVSKILRINMQNKQS